MKCTLCTLEKAKSRGYRSVVSNSSNDQLARTTTNASRKCRKTKLYTALRVTWGRHCVLLCASEIEAQTTAWHFAAWTSICANDVATQHVSHLIAERDIPPGQSVTGELYLCTNVDVTPQSDYMRICGAGIQSVYVCRCLWSGMCVIGGPYTVCVSRNEFTGKCSFIKTTLGRLHEADISAFMVPSLFVLLNK